MVLPARSNPIKFSQLRDEFGDTNPVSLSEYYSNKNIVYVNSVPTTGNPISLSRNFGGLSRIQVTTFFYTSNAVTTQAVPISWIGFNISKVKITVTNLGDSTSYFVDNVNSASLTNGTFTLGAGSVSNPYLVPSNSYRITIQAYDNAVPPNITTLASAPTINVTMLAVIFNAPAIISVSNSSITMSWTGENVFNIRVTRVGSSDNTSFATTSRTSGSFVVTTVGSSLAPNTSYSFDIVGINNNSILSTAVRVTQSTWPVLTVSNILANGFSVSYPNIPNVAASDLELIVSRTTNGSALTNISTNPSSLTNGAGTNTIVVSNASGSTNLSPGTRYFVRLSYKGTSSTYFPTGGNTSTESTVDTVRIALDSATATAISSSTSSIDISWTGVNVASITVLWPTKSQTFTTSSTTSGTITVNDSSIGLTAGTLYTFSVIAYDSSNNASSSVSVVSRTAYNVAILQAPLATTGNTNSSVFTTQVRQTADNTGTLTWTISSTAAPSITTISPANITINQSGLITVNQNVSRTTTVYVYAQNPTQVSNNTYGTGVSFTLTIYNLPNPVINNINAINVNIAGSYSTNVSLGNASSFNGVSLVYKIGTTNSVNPSTVSGVTISNTGTITINAETYVNNTFYVIVQTPPQVYDGTFSVSNSFTILTSLSAISVSSISITSPLDVTSDQYITVYQTSSNTGTLTWSVFKTSALAAVDSGISITAFDNSSCQIKINARTILSGTTIYVRASKTWGGGTNSDAKISNSFNTRISLQTPTLTVKSRTTSTVVLTRSPAPSSLIGSATVSVTATKRNDSSQTYPPFVSVADETEVTVQSIPVDTEIDVVYTINVSANTYMQSTYTSATLNTKSLDNAAVAPTTQGLEMTCYVDGFSIPYSGGYFRSIAFLKNTFSIYFLQEGSVSFDGVNIRVTGLSSITKYSNFKLRFFNNDNNYTEATGFTGTTAPGNVTFNVIGYNPPSSTTTVSMTVTVPNFSSFVSTVGGSFQSATLTYVREGFLTLTSTSTNGVFNLSSIILGMNYSDFYVRMSFSGSSLIYETGRYAYINVTTAGSEFYIAGIGGLYG